jgi:exopolysaccharide biosynthesis polyprenyl glycosylphosphotransferase
MFFMKSIYRIKQLILVVGDIFSYYIALFLALWVRHLELPTFFDMQTHQYLFAWTMFFWIIINYINGLYDFSRMGDRKKFFRQFLETAFISLFVGIIFFYIIPSTNITPKRILVLTILFGYTLSALWRLFAIHLIGGIKTLRTNILFIGNTKEITELTKLLQNFPERGYHVAALIDPDQTSHSPKSKHIEIYKSLRAIRPAISTHNIGLVVISPDIQSNEEAMRELYELLFWPVKIQNLPAFYELITGRIPPSIFSEGWFLEHLRQTENPFYEKGRIFIDYAAAFLLGIILLVFLPFVALAIKLSSNGAIFFTQTRVGRGGKTFRLYKFRSMYSLSPDGSAETDGFQFAKKNDKRITSIGKMLRKTRLDELPQVLNLLKGDITLIGPRPERPEIVSKLTEHMPYYPLRHVVKPGITGWAVLHQNYTDTIEKSLQKLQYDLYYIKNRSFLLDISILLKTINVVVRGLGQ